MRQFRSFSFQDTNLRVCSDRFDALTAALVAHRRQLERYIRRHPAFGEALQPLKLLPDAPEVAVRMADAAVRTGTGPMAGVAGALAQIAVEEALKRQAVEAIVENGGDMFLWSGAPVIVGVWTGETGMDLAFEVTPDEMPLSICSSSSRMGHSMSFGDCDLATVVSKNAALADCAATRLGNDIGGVDDVERALETVGAIDGIDGILVVSNGQLGLFGRLPKLRRGERTDIHSRVTRDRRSVEPK